MPRKSFLRGVGFGIVGGLVGTALMDIVMVLTFLIAGQPASTFFSLVGVRLGYGVLAGIAVHNLVGLTGGIVFSLLVLSVTPPRIDNKRKGYYWALAPERSPYPLAASRSPYGLISPYPA